MRNMSWLIPIILIIASCAENHYVYDFSSSAILKDKAVVNYDIQIEFESQKGVDEFKEKSDKIKHAIRIILVQRRADQIDKSSRLWSVANKVFKSQLNEPITKITVKEMVVDRM